MSLFRRKKKLQSTISDVLATLIEEDVFDATDRVVLTYYKKDNRSILYVGRAFINNEPTWVASFVLTEEKDIKIIDEKNIEAILKIKITGQRFGMTHADVKTQEHTPLSQQIEYTKKALAKFLGTKAISNTQLRRFVHSLTPLRTGIYNSQWGGNLEELFDTKKSVANDRKTLFTVFLKTTTNNFYRVARLALAGIPTSTINLYNSSSEDVILEEFNLKYRNLEVYDLIKRRGYNYIGGSHNQLITIQQPLISP